MLLDLPEVIKEGKVVLMRISLTALLCPTARLFAPHSVCHASKTRHTMSHFPNLRMIEDCKDRVVRK
jgi:hypothetical protein